MEKENGISPLKRLTGGNKFPTSQKILTSSPTDCNTQFGLDIIMNVSTLGTGAVNVDPRNISREDIWSSDFTNPINILLQPQLISLEQVQALSEWFMDNEKSTLVTSTDMIITAIDTKKTGNVSLCNHQKIQMRQCSSIIIFIIKNHLIQSSYTSQNPNKDFFTYKDKVIRRKVPCGLIKLWLCLNVVRPQLVGNYWVHKNNLKDLTFLGGNTNVNTFLTTLYKMCIVIN